MKQLKKLFKRRGADMYRPEFREYLERQADLHGGQYIALAIALAVSAILLQALWSLFSLIK